MIKRKFANSQSFFPNPPPHFLFYYPPRSIPSPHFRFPPTSHFHLHISSPRDRLITTIYYKNQRDNVGSWMLLKLSNSLPVYCKYVYYAIVQWNISKQKQTSRSKCSFSVGDVRFNTKTVMITVSLLVRHVSRSLTPAAPIMHRTGMRIRHSALPYKIIGLF